MRCDRVSLRSRVFDITGVPPGPYTQPRMGASIRRKRVTGRCLRLPDSEALTGPEGEASMAKLAIAQDLATITGMNLKGGALPDGAEFKLDVVIDYSGVTREQLLKVASSGQSTRVALQTKLRGWPVAKLRALNGKLRIAFRDIYAVVEESTHDKLLRLTKDGFWDVMKDYGMSRAESDALWERKHNPKPVVEEETEDDNDDK